MTYLTARADLTPEQCILDCTECHDICLETLNYCLEKGGRYAEAPHVRLLLDGAQLCQATIDFLLRKSDWQGQMCTVCADVCDQCAESCSQFQDDVQMAACGDICQRAVASCRTVAQTGRRVAA